jgi:hypothetical protein
MKRALTTYAAIGLFVVAQALADTTVVEVIALQHRTAVDEVK